jgi:ferredoxin-NADP reductase
MYIASPGERIGLIAGGSGIAPLMSHIRTWQSFNRPVQTTLLYSTRSDSMCYRQELQDLTNTAVHVRETDTEPRFDVESIKNSLSHQSIILICGSRDFVRDMRSVCVEIFPSTPVKAEAFTIDRFDEIHEP